MSAKKMDEIRLSPDNTYTGRGKMEHIYKSQAYRIVRERCLEAILVLFTGMIFSTCFQETINYDEYFSMSWCRLGWGEFWQTLAADVHPPLHYVALKFILFLTDESILAARLLSACMAILLLWRCGLFLKKEFGVKAALFFCVLVYLNPFMIQKATEIRMYLFASCFVCLSGIETYYLIKDPKRKNWICFTVYSLLAAYTHYYALLTVSFLYVSLFFYYIVVGKKSGVRQWFFCAAATVIGYLPWLPIAWGQVTAVNREYWIEPSSSKLAPLRELFYSRIPYTHHIYIGVMVLLMGIALFMLIKKRSTECFWALVCGTPLWGILIFAALYATQVRPILVNRYLIMAVCLCLLGIGSICRYLSKYIVLLFCLFSAIVGIYTYQSAIRAQALHNTAKFIDFMEDELEETDLIMYVKDDYAYGYVPHCLEYYFPEAEQVPIEESWISILSGDVDRTIYFIDTAQYMQRLDAPSANIDNCGTFAFDATEFEVYKISP